MDSIAHPFSTKPELTSQLPALRKQILKYEDYGNKTYESLFPAEVRKNSVRYETNYLQNAILWNNNGNLELAALPIEAQFAPVFGIVADDLDGDGKIDIWLGGNFYALKPQVGRHNASKGVFLKGKGEKSFDFVPVKESGINVVGEVRDAGVIQSANSKALIVARNNEKVLMFEKTKMHSTK